MTKPANSRAPLAVDPNTFKHFSRIGIGVIGAIGAIYTDSFAGPRQRPVIQITLWTFLLFAFCGSELRVSLRRKIQRYIAFGLVILHIVFIIAIRSAFPFENSLIIFAGFLPEVGVLVFLYARIGQSLDPEGPFGLTEAEKQARKARPHV